LRDAASGRELATLPGFENSGWQSVENKTGEPLAKFH
jgi:hypothetical protein